MRWAVPLIVVLGCGQAAAERVPVPGPIETVEAPPDEPSAPSSATRIVHLGEVRTEEVELPSARACVPPGEGPFGVLYAFDGDYYLDELGLCEALAALEGELGPWIVVAVPSTEARTSLLARHPERLAAVLEGELEPRLAALAPLALDAPHRALLGYSYGGLAALEIGLAQPNRYGRVIAQSPSLWFAGRRALGRYERARTLPARLFVDVGALEGDPGEVVPYMVDDARALIDEALGHGLVFGRDVGLREVPGQAHDMALAGARLPEALRFGLGEPHLDTTAPDALSFRLHPAPDDRRSQTFAVEARYGEVILSWPVALANVREGDRSLRTARVRTSRSAPLTASVAGVEGRLD